MAVSLPSTPFSLPSIAILYHVIRLENTFLHSLRKEYREFVVISLLEDCPKFDNLDYSKYGII